MVWEYCVGGSVQFSVGGFVFGRLVVPVSEAYCVVGKSDNSVDINALLGWTGWPWGAK